MSYTGIRWTSNESFREYKLHWSYSYANFFNVFDSHYTKKDVA